MKTDSETTLGFSTLSVTLGRVLSVEDWAEIPRLHRAVRVPIKVISRTQDVVGLRDGVDICLPIPSMKMLGTVA
jgi:hypothetical protein